MRVSFPVSATIPARRWLVDGKAGWEKTAFPIRYGVLERPDGITLIDTGYSDALFTSNDPAVIAYRWLLWPKLDPAEDALAIVQKLGAAAGDVRHIVLTHLHADHACGLQRFPSATLHLSRVSLDIWSAAPGWRDHRMAFYRSLMPALSDRTLRVVETAPAVALPWGGAGHDLFGDGGVVAVDLPGHMPGHFGVFLPHRPRPLFYAVDADWTLPPLREGRRPNWPVRLVVADGAAAERSAALVRAAAGQGAEILLCHDPRPWP